MIIITQHESVRESTVVTWTLTEIVCFLELLYHQLIMSYHRVSFLGASHSTLTDFSAAFRPGRLHQTKTLLSSQRYKTYRCSKQWQRSYSIQTSEDALSKLPPLDPSKLNIIKTTTPMSLRPPEELVFGRSFTGS